MTCWVWMEMPIWIYHWLWEGDCTVQQLYVKWYVAWKWYLACKERKSELALQWAEMRMVRWVCDIKVKDRVLWCGDSVGCSVSIICLVMNATQSSFVSLKLWMVYISSAILHCIFWWKPLQEFTWFMWIWCMQTASFLPALSFPHC